VRLCVRLCVHVCNVCVRFVGVCVLNPIKAKIDIEALDIGWDSCSIEHRKLHHPFLAGSQLLVQSSGICKAILVFRFFLLCMLHHF
jgi:hypothetical protein